MDGKVNDFFNEIEGIGSSKETNPVWQKCFDESTGYTYYWNVKTDKVSWNMPADYQRTNSSHNGNTLGKLPSRPAPLFPSVVPSPPKIYKIQDDAQKPPLLQNRSFMSDDGGEKRTILMAAYGDNTDSEEEEEDSRTVTMLKEKQSQSESTPKLAAEELQINKSLRCSSDSDNGREDDTDLLTKIQNRAKVLAQLGGELPVSVKKIVDHNGCNESAQDKIRKQSRKDVTGFSLVAGYSSDEEEATFPILKPETPPVPSSTLFPQFRPIDVTQFNETKKNVEPPLHNVDTKPFKRKRKFGIDYIDTITKPKVESIATPDDERLGFGFKSVTENESNKNDVKANYTGFRSAGLMFAKPDDNKATSEPEKKDVLVKPKRKIDNNKKYSAEDLKRIEDAHKGVSEKLHFLAEGHEVASPVQTMIIQMETLYDAMKAKSLSIDYLYKWLQDTYTELAKLEMGAAPPGWILKWDRIVKRYYYRNQQSGDCQWNYPEPDIVSVDEAMDISTTPPPPPLEEPLPSPPLPPLPLEPSVLFINQPPPPPRIKSPTPPPPPPPTISKEGKQKQKGKAHTKQLPHSFPDIHPPLPTENFPHLGEPLPPGVDLPQPEIQPLLLVQPNPTEDAIGSALNSFYSDLATMELNTPAPLPAYSVPIFQNLVPLSDLLEKPAKKKKTKVKIVEGLAMKKKGVSKLVEKWKNVQKDY